MLAINYWCAAESKNTRMVLRLHSFAKNPFTVRAAIALQEPTRLLERLFYFIAHETRDATEVNAAMKYNKTFILLKHLFWCNSGFMCNNCNIYFISLHMKPDHKQHICNHIHSPISLSFLYWCGLTVSEYFISVC